MTFFVYPQADTNELKETINSLNDVIDPIRQEFESDTDDNELHERNDYLDDLLVNNNLLSVYKINYYRLKRKPCSFKKNWNINVLFHPAHIRI